MDRSRMKGLASRRLERPAASSCSSAEDSVSPSASSLFTRSLDLPPTSFRIGGGEGEMDRICQTLGIASPDDFGIPVEVWEASRKRSSSDVLPRLRSLGLDSLKIQAEEVGEAYSRCIVAGSSAERDDTESTRPESSELKEWNTSLVDLTRIGLVQSTGFSATAEGSGIKGIRPPLLKPPPPMKLPPPIDPRCSSWDFLRSFAPDSGPGRSSEANQRPVSSSSSDDGYSEEKVGGDAEKEETKADRHDKGSALQSGDTADESCSFTTNDCDTSSTMSPSPNYPPLSIITSWQKGQRLGQGSFGTVYEGIAGNGDFIAIKEVSLLDQGSQAQECIQQLEWEITLLSQLNHPNIVRYRGTCRDGSNLYIFLELVSKGSLLSLYKTYQLGDSQVSAYTRQILHGLKFLHDQGFIHRDIKCANILVHANGLVKLADFGLAKVTKLNDIKSCKGTPFWMAPEVINRKTNDGYGRSADIWSLGCSVLEMLTGQIPYSGLEPAQALFRIGRGELPPVPNTLSPEARDFILQCLNVNPDERPSAAELLNHPFVRRPLQSPPGSGSQHLGGQG
ncbi:PREDICTED: mitogen-activated protein kinase kinase kinase 1-like [Tarenaya hassleriana]|uniref:mitogen-activated protein kinase kinase kinase 1-like n=1 Tax=Tarenaya hassleriana TaxID=28532 RepID=UPI00053C1049|nr:PREDICTED: mitogen-activated protein kinase kinase kinase 1-like [Tarenaya hassleriana]